MSKADAGLRSAWARVDRVRVRRAFDPLRNRRVRRLLRRHQGQTGVIVLGRYFALRWAVDDPMWRQVRVYVNRQVRKRLSQYSRGPYWFDAEPGSCEVTVQSSAAKVMRRSKFDPDAAGVLRHILLTLQPGQVEFVAFRPPASPIYHARRKATWMQTTVR